MAIRRVESQIEEIVRVNLRDIEEDPVNKLVDFADIYLPEVVDRDPEYITNFFLEHFKQYKDRGRSRKEAVIESANDVMDYVLRERQRFQEEY